MANYWECQNCRSPLYRDANGYGETCGDPTCAEWLAEAKANAEGPEARKAETDQFIQSDHRQRTLGRMDR